MLTLHPLLPAKFPFHLRFGDALLQFFKELTKEITRLAWKRLLGVVENVSACWTGKNDLLCKQFEIIFATQNSS